MPPSQSAAFKTAAAQRSGVSRLTCALCPCEHYLVLSSHAYQRQSELDMLSHCLFYATAGHSYQGHPSDATLTQLTRCRLGAVAVGAMDAALQSPTTATEAPAASKALAAAWLSIPSPTMIFSLL